MFSSEIKRAFEECEAFIKNHTPEELEEYESRLKLDYDRYKGGIAFSTYIGEKTMCIKNSETLYTCNNLNNEEKQRVSVPNSSSLYVAA